MPQIMFLGSEKFSVTIISLCLFIVFIHFYSDIRKDERNVSFPRIIAGGSEGACGPQVGLGQSEGQGGQGQARAGGSELGFHSLPPHRAGYTDVQEGKEEATEILAAWMLYIIFGILKTLSTCQ